MAALPLPCPTKDLLARPCLLPSNICSIIDYSDRIAGRLSLSSDLVVQPTPIGSDPVSLLQITTPSGSMPAYLAEPPQHAPRRKPIVLVHEAFGLNPHIQSITDRLAGLGRPTIAPHLHYRRSATAAPYDDVPLAESYVASLTIDAITADLQAAAAVVARGGETVDVVGFCFGGAVAYIAAARLTDVHRAVAFYPVGIRRYWEQAGMPKVPLLTVFGDRDDFLGEGELKWLGGLHDDPDLPIQVRLYPGAGHAFLNEGRPEYYNRERAEEAWSDALDFLQPGPS